LYPTSSPVKYLNVFKYLFKFLNNSQSISTLDGIGILLENIKIIAYTRLRCRHLRAKGMESTESRPSWFGINFILRIKYIIILSPYNYDWSRFDYLIVFPSCRVYYQNIKYIVAMLCFIFYVLIPAVVSGGRTITINQLYNMCLYK